MNFWTWLDRNGEGALWALAIVCITAVMIAVPGSSEGCRVRYESHDDCRDGGR